MIRKVAIEPPDVLGDFLFGTFMMLFHATMCVVGHQRRTVHWRKGLYIFAVFERFFVLSYIVSAVSLHIESNESVMLFHYFNIHLTDGTMNTTFI